MDVLSLSLSDRNCERGRKKTTLFPAHMSTTSLHYSIPLSSTTCAPPPDRLRHGQKINNRQGSSQCKSSAHFVLLFFFLTPILPFFFALDRLILVAEHCFLTFIIHRSVCSSSPQVCALHLLSSSIFMVALCHNQVPFFS